MTQSTNGHSHEAARRTFDVRVLRQDAPEKPSYWERHTLELEPDMNITSVLQRIAAHARNSEGEAVAPVAYDANCLEEVCGSCTMLINGRTRQACSALVEKLLADHPDEIELRPMSKFPVVRDLVVNRARLFRALERVQAWIPIDGYYDIGPGPRQSQKQQDQAYPLMQCMSCGCCLEACPQYGKIELTRLPDETHEQLAAREQEAYDRNFVGAHAISQVVFYNLHPTGALNADARVDALMQEGGIQICGNAQNCVAVCPKEIPLTTSIGRAGRSATVRAIKQWFDK
jgi:succinate dehydrogenase / fumarate reductase, iron-sulfur subunit